MADLLMATAAAGIFPPEVWILIFETRTLLPEHYAQLARTCRTLNRIVTPFLWERVSLSRPQIYNFVHPPGQHKLNGIVHVAMSWARTLKRHEDVAACVKEVELQHWFMKESVQPSPDFPAHEALNNAFEHVISALLKCRNLEKLSLHNVQIPPRLHRAFYHIPSLKHLDLGHCIISCRGQTCAMNPQRLPIKTLRLVQTAHSIHGYNNIINSVEALAEASGIQVLDIDAAVFDHLMNNYIFKGVPSSLEVLRCTPPIGQELSGALLTDLLSFAENPIKSLSVRRDLHGFVPGRILPMALNQLREIAAPKDIVIPLVKGRQISGIKIIDKLSVPQEVLQEVAAGSRCAVTTLAVRVGELREGVLKVTAALFPAIQDLVVEYSNISGEMLKSFAPTLTSFVSSLTSLSSLSITPEGPPTSYGPEDWQAPLMQMEVLDADTHLPYMWAQSSPNLVNISFTRVNTWKRRAGGYEWIKVPFAGNSFTF